MATDPSVSADQGGVAIHGDAIQSPIVTGDYNVVNVTYQGATIRIPSPEAVQRHRAELRCKLEREAEARWGGMELYIHEEGSRLPDRIKRQLSAGLALRWTLPQSDCAICA